MSPRTKLTVAGAVIILSTLYGLLVAKDQDLARTVGVGYVAILLTAFVLMACIGRKN